MLHAKFPRDPGPARLIDALQYQPSPGIWPFALSLALVSTLALVLWHGFFPLDDAYITLSNARALLSGAPDPTYGSSYLTGATSPAHLLILAVAAVIIPATWASLLIGLAGTTLYIAALPRLAGRLAGWKLWTFVFVGACWGYSLFDYVNGLETSIAMATSAWLMLLCDDRRKLPIIAGVAPFIRPELAILASLLMLRFCWLHRRDPKSVLTVLGWAVAAATPWAIWIFWQTGQVIPSTMGAKLVFYRESAFTPSAKLGLFSKAMTDSMLLPLYLGVVGLARVRGGWAGATFIAIVAAVSVALMPNALNWNQARYQAIFIPVLLSGLAVVLAQPSPVARILQWLLIVCTVVTGYVGTSEYCREIALASKVEAHARFVAALPASSVVLIHDAGRVEWERPKARLVDVVGLKTPQVIPLHAKLSDTRCGSPRSLDLIARRYHASHLVVLRRYDFDCIARNLRAAGWRLTPIFDDYYTVYSLSE